MKSALPLREQMIYARRTTASTVVFNDGKGRMFRPFLYLGATIMEKLNFYTVDLSYVDLLKESEMNKRGFSRVPNMDYGDQRKPKFLCCIVLQVENTNYYVPVTSYKQQKPDNFLIYGDDGQVVASLRFNYMFPVPKELLKERRITEESDRAYRSLLAQELLYCRKHQEDIMKLAQRTYNRVLLGKNPGLVANSCDFLLLEDTCRSYIKEHLQQNDEKTAEANEKTSVRAKLKEIQKERSLAQSVSPKSKPNKREER